MRNLGRLAVALVSLGALAGSALAGCGGEGEPKRAVDARTEVVRFFAVDVPAVAMLGPRPVRNLEDLDRSASDLPGWQQLRAAMLGPLRGAEIGPADLRQLVHPQDEIEGVEASALAVGSAGTGRPSRGETLLVLATDQADLLERTLRDAEGAGRVRSAGSLHEALLFAGEGAAFGVRDGVLVSAPSLAGVRTALQRRDGDSDEQLDEDVVNDLRDDLRIDGALDVYADLEGVIESDRALRSLAARTTWMQALRLGALSARTEGPVLEVELVVRTDEDQVEESELPAGDEPSSFEISTANVPALGQPHGDSQDPVVGLLRGITPLAGEATADSEEIRAEASVSP